MVSSSSGMARFYVPRSFPTTHAGRKPRRERGALSIPPLPVPAVVLIHPFGKVRSQVEARRKTLRVPIVEDRAAFRQALTVVLYALLDLERRAMVFGAGAGEVLTRGAGPNRLLDAPRRLGNRGRSALSPRALSTRCDVYYPRVNTPHFWGRLVEMRVLVAFEDEYRGLRESIAFVFGAVRPGDELEVADLGTLRRRAAGFDPHLVIASIPNVVAPGGMAAWVALSPDPHRPSRVCVGGRQWQVLNPSMEDLLSIAEEAEGLVRDERHFRAF